MNIEIITTFENAKDYLYSAEQNDAEVQDLWQKHMIAPYWADITKWAPFDQSFKKPSCVRKLAELRQQLSVFSDISTEDLHNKFISITKALPTDDDDTMLVVLYPLCDSDQSVKERQNGVVGTAVFGNIIIRINPLADNYQKWIPYVFAHEYHHNIWGHNWFVLRGGQGYEGTFLEYMITEGQADLFAESLFPDLIPQWNRPFNNETEAMLWERVKLILFSTDQHIHSTYMFGDEKEGIPWCMGYSFGRTIVADYMQNNPNMTFLELIDVPAKKIFEASRFYA